MAAHRITSKGQVTLPKFMRDAIGLRPGERAEFELDGDRIIVTRGSYERAEDHPLIKNLRELGKHATMSAEEWRSLMRDPEDLV
jgi:AbrB family looped-hinge helix DNA binding protein